MSKRAIVVVKVLLHMLLLAPFAWLLHIFENGALALNADPVNYVTHFTGDWALWVLLGSLAITPLRRLRTSLGFLVRFRRLIGLYAFFYASLHLGTYVFLFSGYDLPGALHAAAAGHPGELLNQWRQVWPTILDDLKKRRFIQVGLLSWIVLLLLTATSPARVMRLIGGKRWQQLHRLVYVAAAAGVVHYWWLVKAGVRTPWRVTAVLSILLVARLLYVALKRRSASRPGGPGRVAAVSSPS